MDEHPMSQGAAAGKAARAAVPLATHADLHLRPDRDPIGLLASQAQSRVADLIPIRYGRMLASPFAFFRGAALPMAADLAATPTSGLRVQMCGDAHVANFGAFASPERRLVFDLNDFDESLPGPFEWDVKRLAASLVVAGRANGFSRKESNRIVLAAVRRYRKAMREFAKLPTMAVWYAGLDVQQAIKDYRNQLPADRYQATEALVAKARTRDSAQALRKLTTVVDGHRRIVSDPPLVVPIEELFTAREADALYAEVRSLISRYSRSLAANRRHLLSQFQVVQMARKVVGVGSVGTRAWIVLMESLDGSDSLFLQAKEAQPSVFAEYAGRSRHANQGQRVVVGQQLMQAVSDIFLGWQTTTGVDGVDRDYYVRQLRDWKFSPPIPQMIPPGMEIYASLCAWTLARAHARTGDRIAIAAYLGKSPDFEHAVAEFAGAYADLNESDHAALQRTVNQGRLEARLGI